MSLNWCESDGCENPTDTVEFRLCKPCRRFESELTKLRAQLEVGTKCLINMVSNETIVQAVLESRLALAKIEALNK